MVSLMGLYHLGPVCNVRWIPYVLLQLRHYATSLLDLFMPLIGCWRNPCVSFPHSFTTCVDHLKRCREFWVSFFFTYCISNRSRVMCHLSRIEKIRSFFCIYGSIRLRLVIFWLITLMHNHLSRVLWTRIKLANGALTNCFGEVKFVLLWN